MAQDYPTVDLTFLIEQIKNSPKVELAFKQGKSSWYILKGSKPISDRSVLIREYENGQINLNFASSCAIKLKFLPELLEWLEKNRNWKEGGYIVPNKK